MGETAVYNLYIMRIAGVYNAYITRIASVYTSCIAPIDEVSAPVRGNRTPYGIPPFRAKRGHAQREWRDFQSFQRRAGGLLFPQTTVFGVLA